MKELYGIDLILPTRLGPMVMRVPGWTNIGVLRARSTPLPIQKVRREDRRSTERMEKRRLK